MKSFHLALYFVAKDLDAPGSCHRKLRVATPPRNYKTTRPSNIANIEQTVLDHQIEHLPIVKTTKPKLHDPSTVMKLGTHSLQPTRVYDSHPRDRPGVVAVHDMSQDGWFHDALVRSHSTFPINITDTLTPSPIPHSCRVPPSPHRATPRRATTRHRITPRHIASHHISSHHITRRYTPLHYTPQQRATPHHATSRHATLG